jgi:capsular polysaccharide biosynthesis protein
MKEIDLNLALVVRLVRHRWPVLASLAVLGALIGAGASLLLSPGYQSSSKVLLQGNRDTASQSSEVQIATSLVVLDRTAQSLQWGETGSDLRGRILASPLDGNVIEIVGVASTPERAQQLTDQATREYIGFSTQIVNDARAAFDDVARQNRDRVQKKVDETQRRVAELEGSPQVSAEGAEGTKARDELARARTTLEQAQGELEKLTENDQNSDLEGSLLQASVRVIEPAVQPSGPASPTLGELIGFGALAAVLLGLLAHLAALRSDRRPRDATGIAVASGAPLLGTVEVAAAARPRSRFSLRDDRRWVEPNLGASSDVAARASRCRRALDRLRAKDGRLHLLALVHDDDADARTAVLDMAVAATEAGRGVSVNTEDRVLVDAVRRAADRLGGAAVLAAGGGGSATPTHIEVCIVPVERPLVPTATAGRATVLVVTQGRRTGWELAQVGAACTEAGQPLAGVVVAVANVVERATGPGRPGGRGAAPAGAMAVRA